MGEEMNYLEAIDYYMYEMGMSEDDACRAAFYIFFPDDYNPEDYDN